VQFFLFLCKTEKFFMIFCAFCLLTKGAEGGIMAARALAPRAVFFVNRHFKQILISNFGYFEQLIYSQNYDIINYKLRKGSAYNEYG
jgi:hypothetical protein